MTEAMRKVMKENDRCELCGSTRELEAHHIIPRVLGGRDVPENILCVCKKCHCLLTPKSELTKIGQHKSDGASFAAQFYRHFEELTKYGERFTIDDVFDYLDTNTFPFVEQIIVSKQGDF